MQRCDVCTDYSHSPTSCHTFDLQAAGVGKFKHVVNLCNCFVLVPAGLKIQIPPRKTHCDLKRKMR